MKRYFYTLSLAIAAICSTSIMGQSATERAEIAPLTKTEWGQQAPFYYKTPIINGEHAKTGCVATAMSQLLYYHQYPKQGKQATFTFDNFSFDFAGHTFDYSKMKPTYDRAADPSDPSVVEVGTLMYACGVTVNMDYGVEASSGNFGMIPGALNEWFLYPIDGMGLLLKDYFTLEEWEEIVYEELAAKRPVLYMGGNITSSHVFLCDGYKDGKFHMNLGWYGEKNAYLPLSNLLTERVGKDGLWSMNSSQRIIRGVRLENDPAPKPLATASTFQYDPSEELFSLVNISCYVNNTKIYPGVRLINNDNNREYEIWSSKTAIINRGNTTVDYTVELTGIEDGNYTIRPIYKLADEIDTTTSFPVYCNIVKTRYYTAQITSNQIINPKEGSDIEVNVSISEYTPASTYIKGERYGYGFTVFAENTGNTTITRLGIRFCKPGTTEEVRNTSYNESLAPGESKTIPLGIPNTADPGEYDLVIYDPSSKEVLSDPIRVIYHSSSEITTIEGSSYRYMPLTPDGDEAMILMPLTSAANIDEDEGSAVIQPTAVINGKEYKIAELGPRLLYGRKDITSITIPATVKKIDVGAFGGCDNISEIKVDATTPPILHTAAFDSNVVETAKITVPEGSLELYKEAPVWEGFNYEVDAEGSDALNIMAFSITPGDSATTLVNLESTQNYYGCQFKVTLPAGLQLTAVNVPETLEAKDYDATYSEVKNDNSYTVVTYSLSNTSYPLGNSSILSMTFKSASNFKGGIISVSDVKLSAQDGSVYKDENLDSSECLVTLGLPTSISEVEGLDGAEVDVYSVAGMLVKSHVKFEEVKSSLNPGLYILRSEGKALKIMVR
ncbi:MAG: C10 family peptidase [Muribaculaceae bacterium]|nr:C10 family peptidase [Muribaculaceae bacterium]